MAADGGESRSAGGLAPTFRPAGQDDLAPAGVLAKGRANLAALDVLASLRDEDRPATAGEQAILARWSGWGAVPGVFDEHNKEMRGLRSELRARLDEQAWAAARRTTLNAHYTPAVVVEAMWQAVRNLGFDGGRVLEPGCGSGNFIGLAPLDVPVAMVGVELDPTTAAVARALYPAADVRAEGFEHSRFPPGFFDATIGNVPFAKVSLYDPAHNSSKLTLHNHFMVKSLALTRPGGLVAVVTSRYTMDAKNPAARREMAGMSDLVGAVRLPAGTMRSAAGTDAITDVVLLRRRTDGAPVVGDRWDQVTTVAAVGGDVEINEYFARHPEHVLGELRAGGGQYRASDPQVRASDRALDEQLAEALAGIVEHAEAAGLRATPRRPAGREAAATVAEVPARSDGARPLAAKEGSIVAVGGGTFARIIDGVPQRFEVKPKGDRGELAALLGLRDAMRELLELEADTTDDVVAGQAREVLNARYDAYVAGYGPLNRFRLVRTSATDPETGELVMRQARPSMGRFRQDPDFRSVMALEEFDPDTQQATKAAIFTVRVVALRHARLGADTGQDALAICLDEHGRVDLDVIAGLLGTDPSAARAELSDLVWDDPAAGGLVTAQRYLSGNVRAKLAEAETAAAQDPRWRANVAALRAVMPVDLGPAEIDGRLGAPWVAPSDIAAFTEDVFGCQGALVEYASVTSTWAVQVPTYQRRSVAARSEWGTDRADGFRLLEDALNQTTTTVHDPLPDGGRTVNLAETLAAREKQEALHQRFSAWLWEDPARADRLAAEYNARFNATVLPTYDGGHLTIPGLAANFIPHPHQRDAVWRIVSEPTVLLAHDVGAGKTASMAMGACELRRLGLVRKPAIVVPNHMLDQFAREFHQLYPQAKVLVADKDDRTAEGRKGFVARCATGDWDAVIMTGSTFQQIPVSDATRARFEARRVAELRQAISESTEGLTVKRLEAAIARAEQSQARLLAAPRKDDGVLFEAMGIDYLLIDECHLYKARQITSRIPGVAGNASQRAMDLEMKLGVLRERHGDRVATFATATPIANSLAEMYTMQAYLQPERLAAAGVSGFDAWAATFGRTVTALELAPDGGSYRMNTRFARFRNVPELLTMFRATADVRSAAQLGLNIPGVVGGHPMNVVVAASEGLQAYVASLVERAERVRSRLVRPEEDNMLKVAGDGRRAALDLRLVGLPPDPDGGKMAVAADRIAAIYREGRDATYVDPAGKPSPNRGSLQVVFCDLGTPKGGDEWSVYREVRHQLAARGVPERLVRFIHEATDDQAKADLFAACREGRVAVLVGSTEKMGVGTNVQRRLAALHHLDAPWRPADIAQREGRALRQGNQNAEVAINRYVTEGSFDVFMWQTLERKQAFIHQVMSGESTDRDVEDIGDIALSFAEIKALATGNPLIMEKAGIDNDVARLQRLRQAHLRDQTALDRRVTAAEAGRARAEERAELAKRAIAARVDTKGGAFAMTLDDTVYRKRPDAGGQLKVALAAIEHQGHAAARLNERGTTTTRTAIGQFGGFPLTVDGYHDRLESRFVLRLEGTPVELSLTSSEAGAANGEGLVARLESRIRGLEAVEASAIDDAERFHAEAEAARRRLGQPFDQEQTLMTLFRRQTEIQEKLAGDDPPDGEAAAPSQDPASTSPSPGPEAARPEQPNNLPPTPAEVEESAVPVRANTRPDSTAPDMVTTGGEPLPQRDDQPERHPASGLEGNTRPEDRDQWGPSAGAGKEVREVPHTDLPSARPLPAVAADQAPSADRPTLGRDEATDRETWSKFLVPIDFRHIDPAMYRYETSAGPADALDVWLAAEPWADTDSDAALAMSRADERLRVVAPDPMAQYDERRARGQEPLAAMRAVAPLVERMDGKRWGQPSMDTSAEAGAARPSADAGSVTSRLGPWASLNSSDRPAASAEPDPIPRPPDRHLEI